MPMNFHIMHIHSGESDPIISVLSFTSPVEVGRYFGYQIQGVTEAELMLYGFFLVFILL